MANDATLTALLNTSQTAEYIGLSASTIAKDRVHGVLGIPYVKLGAAVRYRRSDLDQWIAARVRTSTSEQTAA